MLRQLAEVSRIVRIGGLERRNLARTHRNRGYYRKTTTYKLLERERRSTRPDPRGKDEVILRPLPKVGRGAHISGLERRHLA